MSAAKLLFISALAVTTIQAAQDHDYEKHPSCQQFTQGLSFYDSQALGVWHLLHYKTETDKGKGDFHCVEFSLVNDEERENFSNYIGKFVENLPWEKMTLKMQVPCSSVKTNRPREFYLERLAGDGSYWALQVPPPKAKLNLVDSNRFMIRMKLLEEQYLGMMDCHGSFVFLLGKQAPEGTEVDERLNKMIETYRPEDN